MEQNAKPKLTKAQLMKKNANRQSALRAAIQLFFFVMMPGAFAAGFNGVKYVFRTMSSGGVLKTDGFLLAFLFLAAFTVLFGRFFCGYICAFGSFGDLVFALGELLRKHVFKRKSRIVLPQKTIRLLQKLKYLNLAFIVAFCAFGIDGLLRGTSAWDVFSMLTSFKPKLGGYAIGVASLGIIIVLMASFERGFCRFLCPLGAVFSLLPILPFAALRRKSENCMKGCKLCENACPVNIKLSEDGALNGECICCEKCTCVCPRGNIAHTEKKFIRSNALAAVIKAAFFFLLGSLVGLCRFF